MDILLRYRKQIIVGVVVLILLITIPLLYRYFFTLYVVSSTPSQSQSASFLTPAITLTLNKAIDSESVDITTPAELVTSYTVTDNVLNINIFSGLEANSEYEFLVDSITSINGVSLSAYTYTLQTNDSTELSGVEQELILERQQENKPDILNDPLFSALPYFTEEFYLNSILDATSDGAGQVLVEATIFLTRDQSRNSRTASIAAIRNKVVSYVNSIEGVSVSDYEIVYIIQEP